MRSLFLLLAIVASVSAQSKIRLSPADPNPPTPMPAADNTLRAGQFKSLELTAPGPITWRIIGTAVTVKEYAKETVIYGDTVIRDDDELLVKAGGAVVRARKQLAEGEADTVLIEAWGVEGGKAKLIDSLKVTVVGSDPRPAPDPTDPLTVAIKAAYAEESPSPALMASLAAVYHNGATKAGDAATWGDLFAAMADDAGKFGVSGKLPKVQAAISQHLKANLPSAGATTKAIDADGRKKAAATFTAVANAVTATITK